MNTIKEDFETVVRCNMTFIMNFVKSRLNNKALAEDIVQEIFLKAFKAYGSYTEEGHIKGWLTRIARNTINSYYSRERVQLISLDSSDDECGALYNSLSHDETPENTLLRKELVSDILSVVERMPDIQKTVFVYRFLRQYTVSETAALTHIPEGSVKSKSHYAIEKIRSELGIKQHYKRSINMTCNEAYKYLFMYAKGTLEIKNKEPVEKHIKSCSFCSDIVSALKKLVPSMTYARDDETTHFLINFPQYSLTYCGVSAVFGDTERMNKYLEENNGIVPKNENWISSGFSKCNNLIGMFDNEGNEINFVVFEDGYDRCRINATYIKKLYPSMWIYYSYLDDGNSPNTLKKSLEAPNLYYGSMHNCMGNNTKSALYQAIPAEAENIRIKRGNGVLDCGSCKFAFVDRYVTEEERITLDYSYLLN